MTKALVVAILVCLTVVLAATAVGRAVDQAIQNRVIFTQGGETFDCERRFTPEGERIVFEDGSSSVAMPGGEWSYEDCHNVPAP